LEFWKQKEKDFPQLSKLAKIYLGFPASSGSVERLFSVSGSHIRARRARMKLKTVESLLFDKELRKLPSV